MTQFVFPATDCKRPLLFGNHVGDVDRMWIAIYLRAGDLLSRATSPHPVENFLPHFYTDYLPRNATVKFPVREIRQTLAGHQPFFSCYSD